MQHVDINAGEAGDEEVLGDHSGWQILPVDQTVAQALQMQILGTGLSRGDCGCSGECSCRVACSAHDTCSISFQVAKDVCDTASLENCPLWIKTYAA